MTGNAVETTKLSSDAMKSAMPVMITAQTALRPGDPSALPRSSPGVAPEGVAGRGSGKWPGAPPAFGSIVVVMWFLSSSSGCG